MHLPKTSAWLYARVKNSVSLIDGRLDTVIIQQAKMLHQRRALAIRLISSQH